MKAIILVGGFGTRLRPLTYSIPKQMLPIVEVPMIERKIAHLVSSGVDDVVLSMGYKPDAFQRAYPENQCAGARLTYVVEPEPLDTAGAIAFAARETGIDETFLAMNGDTLIDFDVRELVHFHGLHGAEGTLSLTPVDDPSRFGVVPTDDDGRVIAFIEKPNREDAPTNLINAGTYVLEPTILDRIPTGQKVSIERDVFPRIVEEGRLFAGSFGDYWLDIGTPEAYVQANIDVLDQDLAGNRFIADSAHVADDTVIKRSVIGTGARVESGATVVDSVLLPGAVVGSGATIDRSVVAEYATVGAGAQLTNFTVVGGHCAVEAGAVLDGEKVSPPQ